MKHDPADPNWPDRDRFVLSNGHASILQYSMLYLVRLRTRARRPQAVPPVGVADARPSRRPATPPASRSPPARSARASPTPSAWRSPSAILRARFGTEAIDHHTFVIAGDGCFMEGVSHEAASLAGHLGLGKLICVYDDNHITIDGADVARLQRRHSPGGSRAYGWDVVELGEMANDLDGLAKRAPGREGRRPSRPSLLILRSHIGYPSPDHTDDHEAHGLAFDADDVTRTKAVMGIPDEPFWAPAGSRRRLPQPRRHRRRRRARRRGPHDNADDRRHARVAGGVERDGRPGMDRRPADRRARRVDADPQGDRVGVQRHLPYPPGPRRRRRRPHRQHRHQAQTEQAQSNGRPAGRSPDPLRRARARRWGRRWSAWRCTAGSCRSAARSSCSPTTCARRSGWRRCRARRRVFVFTHDSVGVGEDGPTHQPDRAARHAPGDPRPPRDPPGRRQRDRRRRGATSSSTTARRRSSSAARTSRSSPTARRSPRGAGIVHEPRARPDVVLVGTGSEVARVRRTPRRELADHGVAARVVSMPSWDRFEQQDERSTRSILPAGVPVLSVEAATTFGWASLRRRLDRHRALRRQRTRQRSCSTSSASTSSMWSDAIALVS